MWGGEPTDSVELVTACSTTALLGDGTLTTPFSIGTQACLRLKSSASRVAAQYRAFLLF